MQEKIVLSWIKSPIAGRRRKAIKQLTKNALRDPSKVNDAIEAIKALVNDEDWSVRCVALGALTDITLSHPDFIRETTNILLDKFDDESVNVRLRVLHALTKLVRINEDIIDEDLMNLIEKGLNDENSGVREATLRFLVEVIEKNPEVLRTHLEMLNETVNDANPLVRKYSIEALISHLDVLNDEEISSLKELLFSKLTDPSIAVRCASLKGLEKLLLDNKLPIDNEFINSLRKKLRDQSIPVKLTALSLVRDLVAMNPRLADHFFDIIASEYLLKEKNLNFKLEVLEFLKEFVKKIPVEIINRHNIPRALDILEKATVPKSPKRQRIKDLTRYILEDLLGYTYEVRKKKWGEVLHREK